MALNAASIQRILHAKPEIVKLKVECDDKNAFLNQQYILMCPFCSKLKFLSTSTLAIHISRNHEQVLESTNEISEEPIKYKRRKCKCNVCGKIINQNNFENHQRLHRSDKYECHFCQAKLASARSIKRHILEVHQKVGRKECPHCPQTFSEGTSYKRHLARHTEGGFVPCEVCKKPVNKYLLRYHMKTHESQPSSQKSKVFNL